MGKVKLLFFISFILFSQIVYSQTDFSKISINLGLRQNYKSNIENVNQFSFYPEIKFGGKFIKNYLEWDFALGYFNSSDNDKISVKDMAFYSYKGFIFGTHLSFFPRNLIRRNFLPIYLLSGLSYNLINEKYIGGSDLTGFHRKDNSFGIITFDLGLGAFISLNKNMRIDLNGIVKLPIKEKLFLENSGRSSEIKIGFDYFLK